MWIWQPTPILLEDREFYGGGFVSFMGLDDHHDKIRHLKDTNLFTERELAPLSGAMF